MRCPACEASAQSGADACPNGHPLTDEHGTFVLLSGERRAEVAALEEAVGQWRATQGRSPIPAAALPDLPDGPRVEGDHEWRLRRHDLALVIGLLQGRRGLRILDVGSWNGWLSHRLSWLDHDVTATDIFAGPSALGAPWPEPRRWRRVQLEPTELDRLEETFDVVILDRCLQFVPDAVEAITTSRQLLVDDGLLLATGLMVYRSGRAAQARRDAEARRFRRRFGRDLFLHASKGYLDWDDLRRFEQAGLATHRYRALRLSNLRALLDRSRPEHRYGIANR